MEAPIQIPIILAFCLTMCSSIVFLLTIAQIRKPYEIMLQLNLIEQSNYNSFIYLYTYAALIFIGIISAFLFIWVINSWTLLSLIKSFIVFGSIMLLASYYCCKYLLKKIITEYKAKKEQKETQTKNGKS